jgi:demethylmenaquinone methyltransferase/2-methoxy-6-polyprenyl-1,4-benzoquinol methylase
MATGTGALALDLARRPDVEVVGADITRPMLTRALSRIDRNGASDRIGLVECSAEMPPFADGSFDALVFAYLLRYVGDVSSTLCCLAPLVKPGGTIASLDFRCRAASPTRCGDCIRSHPAGGRTALLQLLATTGSFRPEHSRLLPSLARRALARAWRDAGIVDVQSKRLSLGGAIVIWGRRPS